MSCRHEAQRKLVRRGLGTSKTLTTHLQEMYERYDRERRERGIRGNQIADSTWRQLVRWEWDRHERSKNLDT